MRSLLFTDSGIDACSDIDENGYNSLTLVLMLTLILMRSLQFTDSGIDADSDIDEIITTY